MIYLIIIQLFLNSNYAQPLPKDAIDAELDALIAEMMNGGGASYKYGMADSIDAELDAMLAETLYSKGANVSVFGSKDDQLIRLQSKKRNYSLLEKEVPPSKFDKYGFHKQRYDEAITSNSGGQGVTSYSGGHVCLGNQPDFIGKIAASKKDSSIFHDGDEVEIEFVSSTTCKTGERYIAVDAEEETVYKISGVLEVVDKALKPNRCVAVVKQVFDLLRRDAKITVPLVFDTTTSSSAAVQTGKVHKFTPSLKTIAGEGERVCVVFNNQQAPKPGTIVYFYNIKDPNNAEQEVDPYVVATGKLIHTSGSYGTAVVTASKSPVTQDATVSTRF